MSFLAGLVFRHFPSMPDAPRRIGRALLDESPGRGADDTGVWSEGAVALGSRALRTLDLTPDGAQPVRSPDGRITVVLDGYIANAPMLRRDLEEADIRLHGHGDAELIAAGAALWGLNRLLQKMDGAFAFALWDAEDRALHLVRDRMGIKPVYVAATDGAFAFASDPRAFRALDGFTPVISHDAAACYLARGHVMPPLAMWDGVVALPPAHRMMLRDGLSALPQPEGYWSAAGMLEENALRTPIGGDETLRFDRLASGLTAEAIRLDVPFGLLDDFSPASSLLRTRLDHVCDRPFKTYVMNALDGASLQTGFDALARLPAPVSDPMAPAWIASMRRAGADNAVALVATGLSKPVAEGERDARIRRMIEKIPYILRRFVPAKYAHLAQDAADVYAARIENWNGLYETVDLAEPRLDLSLAQKLAFYDFVDGFSRNYAPALDSIAGSLNLDLRLPLADARAFEYGLPCPPGRAVADIAAWLRGPLRPKMQDLLAANLYDRLGISDPRPFAADWQAFLAGDNAPARRLWTLATLLAWTKAHL